MFDRPVTVVSSQTDDVSPALNVELPDSQQCSLKKLTSVISEVGGRVGRPGGFTELLNSQTVTPLLSMSNGWKTFVGTHDVSFLGIRSLFSCVEPERKLQI